MVKKIYGICKNFLKHILYQRNFSVYRKYFWEKKSFQLHEQYGKNPDTAGPLEHALAEVQPQLLLDMGCNDGRNFIVFQNYNIRHIDAFDISPSAIDFAKRRNISNVSCFISSFEDFIPEKKYDLCLSIRFLQHIPPNILKIKINDIINHSKYIYIDDISEEEMYYNNYTLSHYIYVHDYKSIFKKMEQYYYGQ